MKNAIKLLLLAAVVLAMAAALAACGGGSDEETISGNFEPTEEAPAAYAGLAGEAELTRADGGTTVSIDLTGLEPNTEYISHLHIGGCKAPLVGGPHFKFDPEGSDEPPNEIHLMFSSDADGAGEAEASSEQEVPEGEAGSVVLHLASEAKMAAFVHEEEHEHPDKIACAELEGPVSDAAKAAEQEAAAEDESDSMDHSEDEHDASASGTTIVIENGEPVDGIAELEYSAGDEIEFTVESDVAEEIHVHGYDLNKEVPAGGSVTFSFPAEIEGIFEVEMEGQAVQIAELRVNP
jgi:Cu-Zn family superoxide dismutase